MQAPLPDDNPVDNSWDDSAWTTDNAGNAQEEAQPGECASAHNI